MKTLVLSLCCLVGLSGAGAFAEQMPFTFVVKKESAPGTEEFISVLKKVLNSPFEAVSSNDPRSQCVVGIQDLSVQKSPRDPNFSQYFVHAELACPSSIQRQVILDFITIELTNYSGLKLEPSIPSHGR